ncbi:hypothetical protein VTK56DRAFT_5235 [Thermocarpiscus australiensis]
MSSRRVLVGLTSEHAPPFAFCLRRRYGSGPGLTRSLRTAAARPCSSPMRTQQFKKPCASSPKPFHTTSRQPRPWPFRLAPPKAPSIHLRASASASDPPTPLPEQVRSLMRLLTHSVVVCTSTLPGPGTTAPRAMTVSSFTSLALSPTPVVSFNVATPSRTLDAVAASRRFNVHVLADDASGARIADRLARGNAAGTEVFERLARECGCDITPLGPGGGGEYEPPVLRGDGVLYVLRCKLLEDQPARGLVRVRDHVIVLGEVLEILEGPGAEQEGDGRFGLLYADRRYRQLGNCIVPGAQESEGE